MRPYDTRIGRPICIDPITKKYPELSPYQFFSNNPIMYIDLDGLEGVIPYSQIFTPEHNTKYGPTAGKIALITAKTVVIGALVIYAPAIGIPLALSDVTGAPVLPAPQAYATIATSELVTETLMEAELESGAYGNLKGMKLGEKHHVPTNSSMNEVGITKSKGTAINIEKTIHRGLPSTGNSIIAKAFRNKELQLLKSGKYEEAWNMNSIVLKETYLKKGFSEKIIDKALGIAKADFMERVVPKIKKTK